MIRGQGDRDVEKLLKDIRDEEVRLLAELKLIPAYRRWRAVRAMLAAYADPATPLEAAVGVEAAEAQADLPEPPLPPVRRFPARRRRGDLAGLDGKASTRELVIEAVVAYLTEKGARAKSSELMAALVEKGHILDMSKSGASGFCGVLAASGRFNNQRGRGLGYGLKDWPLPGREVATTEEAEEPASMPMPASRQKKADAPWPVVQARQ